MLIEPPKPTRRHQKYDSSPYIKEDIGDFMLWRPFCPPFCLHEIDMSETNFIKLNRFLDLKNLYVATKIMCLAQILKKILRILSFVELCRTSMARTLMARLPWLLRTHSGVPWKDAQSCRFGII